LIDLQLEYVDLFLVHWPVFLGGKSIEEQVANTKPIHILWKEMEDLKNQAKSNQLGFQTTMFKV